MSSLFKNVLINITPNEEHVFAVAKGNDFINMLLSRPQMFFLMLCLPVSNRFCII